jgi:hypothetical protein
LDIIFCHIQPVFFSYNPASRFNDPTVFSSHLPASFILPASYQVSFSEFSHHPFSFSVMLPRFPIILTCFPIIAGLWIRIRNRIRPDPKLFACSDPDL